MYKLSALLPQQWAASWGRGAVLVVVVRSYPGQVSAHNSGTTSRARLPRCSSNRRTVPLLLLYRLHPLGSRTSDTVVAAQMDCGPISGTLRTFLSHRCWSLRELRRFSLFNIDEPGPRRMPFRIASPAPGQVRTFPEGGQPDPRPNGDAASLGPPRIGEAIGQDSTDPSHLGRAIPSYTVQEALREASSHCLYPRIARRDVTGPSQSCRSLADFVRRRATQHPVRRGSALLLDVELDQVTGKRWARNGGCGRWTLACRSILKSEKVPFSRA